MILFDGVGALIALGVWIFCIIDVIVTDEADIKYMPKIVWLILVILLVDIGSIVWLLLGHPWQKTAPSTGARRTFGSGPRQARTASNPDDDEDFLRQVRARAEQQRERARREKEARETEGGDFPDQV